MMERSAPAANFTNEIMAARFSEVMWLVEQIMWKSMDRRVAAFLLAAVNQGALFHLPGDQAAEDSVLLNR